MCCWSTIEMCCCVHFFVRFVIDTYFVCCGYKYNILCYILSETSQLSFVRLLCIKKAQVMIYLRCLPLSYVCKQ